VGVRGGEMIEETPVFSLFQRVRVKALRTNGMIYETATADSGNRIYGVKLDKTVWAGGLRTEVWHCPSEELREEK